MRLGSSVWCIRSERKGRPMSRRFSREVGRATTVKTTGAAPRAGVGEPGARRRPGTRVVRPAWDAVPGSVRYPGGGQVHIVIMGCGRVGSTIAHTLEARGHSVAV